ncbi:hypothetical protein KI387_012744, partial [Taxus chinensis]
RPIVKEKTLEPENPSDKDSSREEEIKSPMLESPVRKKQRIEEDTTSEETGSLERYIGEKDDENEEDGSGEDDSEEEDPEKDQEPPIFNVHDSKEEGREEEHGFLFIRRKDIHEGEGSQGMRRSEED